MKRNRTIYALLSVAIVIVGFATQRILFQLGINYSWPIAIMTMVLLGFGLDRLLMKLSKGN